MSVRFLWVEDSVRHESYVVHHPSRDHRKKWYFFGFRPPGNDSVACCYMLRSFLYIWFTNILHQVSPLRLRKILSIFTTVNLVYGFITLIIGCSQMSGRKSKLDPNPYNPIANSHYIGLTIMGAFIFLFSFFAFIGIYLPNLKYVKGISVLSFLFAYLLISVYISWLSQIYFIRMNKPFVHEPYRKDLDDLLGHRAINLAARLVEVNIQESYIYNLTYFFMNMIIVAAILQIAVGILSLWLLVLHTSQQGFIPVYYREQVGKSKLHFIFRIFKQTT